MGQKAIRPAGRSDRELIAVVGSARSEGSRSEVAGHHGGPRRQPAGLQGLWPGALENNLATVRQGAGRCDEFADHSR